MPSRDLRSSFLLLVTCILVAVPFPDEALAQAPPPGSDAACAAKCEQQYDRGMKWADETRSTKGYYMGLASSNCPSPWQSPATANACLVAWSDCDGNCSQPACKTACKATLQTCCYAVDTSNRAHDRDVCQAACAKSAPVVQPLPPSPSGVGAATSRPAPPAVEQVMRETVDRDRQRQQAFAEVERGLRASNGNVAVVSGGDGRLWVVLSGGARVLLPPALAQLLRSKDAWAMLGQSSWAEAQLASMGIPADATASILKGAGGGGPSVNDYVNFTPGQVIYFLPDTSLSTCVATEPPARADMGLESIALGMRRRSSEHGSCRGTINGGGDFIGNPVTPDRASRGRFVRASNPAIAPADTVNVRLPSAMVSSPDPYAEVVVELAASGISAVAARSGTVVVRELATGQERRLAKGQGVLVVPGVGVSGPKALATALPLIAFRGAKVLTAGEQWSGQLRLESLLVLESRLLADRPAGAAYALEVEIDGHRLMEPLKNKAGVVRLADERAFEYRNETAGRWLTFFSPDFRQNNLDAAGPYRAVTDPGQAYRYVWDISKYLTSANVVPVTFRNGLAPGGASLEVRLLAANAAEGIVAAAPEAGPARASAVRVSEAVGAARVVAGRPVGVADTFPPDLNPIYIWFRIEGASMGMVLRSRWRWLGGASPVEIGRGETEVPATANYGMFEYGLAAGKHWPEGQYEVDILQGDRLLGTARFRVRAGGD